MKKFIERIYFFFCTEIPLGFLSLGFLGIFIFHYFRSFFTPLNELILNLLLIIFLLHFIWIKISREINKVDLNIKRTQQTISSVMFRTLGFTYLNAHVYSDTVFFLGNFSKNFILKEKILFGLGASVSSILFFFTIGYTSKYLSSYLKTKKIWKVINLTIIIFMSFLTTYVFSNIINYFSLQL